MVHPFLHNLSFHEYQCVLSRYSIAVHLNGRKWPSARRPHGRTIGQPTIGHRHMRIFLAGATGAVGKHLIPLLRDAGQVVIGTTRSPEKAEHLRAQGVEPEILDALDRQATVRAVMRARPDAIVHQLTAIPANLNLRRFDREFAFTNRLRTEGTDNLLAAARAAGVRRVVAQSFAGWIYERVGGSVKTEDDPLDRDPPAAFRRTLDAIRYLEAALQAVADLETIALRYGWFYGPATSLRRGAAILDAIRRRQFPIVGSGNGIWSFTHIADAAAATAAALQRGAPGIYNVADDEPAPVREWLPFLANAIGAPPARRVPSWLGRMLIGQHGVVLMNEIRGCSNTKVKTALDWRPRYPSWRTGFIDGLG
jgi:nucleoside-diphosphate-sugar epimerase